MDGKEYIEWWIYDVDHNDYFFSLNKDSLSKVINWESIKTTLYYSFNWKSIDEVENWIKKDLVMCLLSDEERRKKMSEAIAQNNNKDSTKVTIKISKKLLENLLEFEWSMFWGDFEYRYNVRGDKMHFYMNDSFDRKWLSDNLEFYGEVFEKNEKENK